jgi:hypothetical protein
MKAKQKKSGVAGKLSGPGEVLVYEGPGTRHRDYVLGGYKPLPAKGPRLHSFSAYRFALERAGCLAAAEPLLGALRSELGEDETVWGITWSRSGFSSELYFYNHKRNPPGNPKSAARIREILRPFVDIAGRAPESAPYFMCSLNLDPAGLKAGRLAEFKLYLGAAACGPCGFSFLAAEDGLRLENHYHFYPMPAGLREVRYLAAHSARGGAGAVLRAKLLPDWLADCGTICYAVKPLCDGLYFSRITTAQLQRFLSEYPSGPVKELFSGSAGSLAHLLWDVGINFSTGGGRDPGSLEISKTGLYGIF